MSEDTTEGQDLKRTVGEIATERGHLPATTKGGKIRPIVHNPNHWRLVAVKHFTGWDDQSFVTEDEYDKAIASTDVVIR
jgi:hypothetical protein